MKQIKTLAALCLVALMAVSCGTTARKKRIPTVQFMQYGLVEGKNQAIKKSDIEISLTSIRPSDMYDYPNLFSFSVDRLPYPSEDRALLKRMYPTGPGGTSWEFPFMSPSGKLSLLMCWVKLVNGTDHILRMRDARVYLIVEGEDPLPAFGDMKGLFMAADQFEGLANQQLAEQHNKALIKIGEAPQLPNEFYRTLIRSHGRSYKLINDVSKEILPGFTYNGLLVFPVMPEIQGKARIAFYDITTKTDRAGNPVEKARFEFPLERQEISMWYDKEANRWREGVPPTAASE